MDNMIELLGERTGNCLRVAVALEEVGLPYVTTRVNLGQREQKSPAFLAINRAGRVPAIVDRSTGSEPFRLAQSNAIIVYLDQKVPGVLFPTDPKGRTITFERFFYFITDVMGPEMSALRTYGDTKTRAMLLHLALTACVEAEAFLEDSAYMAGPEFTAADIAGVTFMMAYHNHFDWEKLPRLRDWFERSASRPSVVRGMAAFNG